MSSKKLFDQLIVSHQEKILKNGAGTASILKEEKSIYNMKYVDVLLVYYTIFAGKTFDHETFKNLFKK